MSYQLAVRPEGYVQLIDAEGVIPAPDGLSIDECRCRHCRRRQPVTSTRCSQCQIDEPLRVEVTSHGEPTGASPIPVYASEELPADADEVVHLAEMSSAPAFMPAPVLTTVPAPQLGDDEESTRVRRPATPSLHLAFTTQRSMTVPGRVVIGRKPVANDGEYAVTVVSPGRQLSRTHAVIEVDQDPRIMVTDLNAPNGVGLLTTRPRWLIPGETVVPIGVQLMLGDVECIVTLA